VSWLIPTDADHGFVANLDRDDDSVRLARLLAPALRIDVTLLRNMRMRYLPRSDAGLESALWFSDLAVSRSARAISFPPGVARLLTDELDTDIPKRPTLSEVAGFIQQHAADWPRETRLEQRLRLAARADDTAGVREGLRSVLRWFEQAADDPARHEILRWVRGAVPELVRPEWALEEAHWLTQIAAATLGDTTGELAAGNLNAEGVPSWLSQRLPADHGNELGLNVRPGQLQFVESGTGTHTLPVGPAIPALLGLQPGENSETYWERIWAGQVLPIPQDTRRLTLITLSGNSYDLLIEEELKPSEENIGAQARLPERVRLLHLPEEEKEAWELTERLQAMGISVIAVIDNPDQPREDDRSRREPGHDDVPAIRLWTRRGAKYYANTEAMADAWQGLVVRLDDIPLPEGIHDISPVDLFEGGNRFSEQGLERLRGALSDDTPALTIWLAYDADGRELAMQLRRQIISNGISCLDNSLLKPAKSLFNQIRDAMRKADAVFVLHTDRDNSGDYKSEEVDIARSVQRPLFHVQLGTGIKHELYPSEPVLTLDNFQQLTPQELQRLITEWQAQNSEVLGDNLDAANKASKPNGHIFLSYAREDQEKVFSLASLLEAEGWTVWWGRENLPADQQIPRIIDEAIQNASCVLVCWSRSSIGSRWVIEEATEAETQGKLLQVLFEQVRLPDVFNKYQYIDLSEWSGQRKDDVYQRLVEALADKQPPTNIDENTQKTTITSDVQALLDQIDNPSTEPKERLAIGNKLAALGDPRHGTGLDEQGRPDIDWVEISGGTFLYGEEKETRELPGFYIARYPITNAQYQAFIDGGGYKEARWWKGLEGRADRPEKSGWTESNRPRESVNWHEAMAFCSWLSDKLGYTVQLPTEVQWERAARGTDGRNYPWGESYRSGYANTNEIRDKSGLHHLKQTTAVGVYPQGGSPEGVQDLVGNVWEWCQNEYHNPENTDLRGIEPRFLRGGAWANNPGDARASTRYKFNPGSRSINFGFRVFCSSPMPR